MRWYKPESGDIKVKRKFALLPITINKETRWLEWVVIQYHWSYAGGGWIRDEFVNGYKK